ncbi:MAG: TIGR02391 family protein [Roseomonas sp.]|nr:TIGR02391 family protein [Roseomonas sp.]
MNPLENTMGDSPLHDWPVSDLEDLSPESAARAIVVWFLSKRHDAAPVPTQWGIASQVAKRAYPGHANLRKLQIVVAEGVAWGLANGLLCREPHSGMNHDTLAPTRLAEALYASGRLSRWLPGTGLRREDLHPKIAEACWDSICAGKHDVAVFEAFRALEEAARAAQPDYDGKSGADVFSRAFNKDNGPLRDRSALDANENEAWRQLFVGAYGAFRNPPALRSHTKSDMDAVREELMLASLLFRRLDRMVAQLTE